MAKQKVVEVAAKREIVEPAKDKAVGENAAGEKLYERKDGSRYRMHSGKPDFGGDLADAKEEAAFASEQQPKQKKCPNCSKDNFWKAPICGHCKDWDFLNNRRLKKSEGTGQGAGKGKKFCPGCKMVVGINTKKCQKCNHEFEFATRLRTTESTVRKVSSAPPRIVAAPAGKPPCSPKGHPYETRQVTEEELLDWMIRVKAAGGEKNITYTPDAMRYFVRFFWDMSDNREEYERVCDFVLTNMRRDGTIIVPESENE